MTHIECSLKCIKREFLLSCNLALIVLVLAIEVYLNLLFLSINLEELYLKLSQVGRYM